MDPITVDRLTRVFATASTRRRLLALLGLLPLASALAPLSQIEPVEAGGRRHRHKRHRKGKHHNQPAAPPASPPTSPPPAPPVCSPACPVCQTCAAPGQCVPVATDTPCGAGKACCSGTCTTLGTDTDCHRCGDACTAPETCGGGGTAGQCDCTPTSCAAQGKDCGMIPDTCGAMLDCGATCDVGEICGGGGTANVCGCVEFGMLTAWENQEACCDGSCCAEDLEGHPLPDPTQCMCSTGCG